MYVYCNCLDARIFFRLVRVGMPFPDVNEGTHRCKTCLDAFLASLHLLANHVCFSVELDNFNDGVERKRCPKFLHGLSLGVKNFNIKIKFVIKIIRGITFHFAMLGFDTAREEYK